MMFPNAWAQRFQNPIYPGTPYGGLPMQPPMQPQSPMQPGGMQPPMMNGWAQRTATPVMGGQFQVPAQSMMRPAMPEPFMQQQQPMPQQPMQPQMPMNMQPQQQQVQNALRMRMGMQ